MLAQQPSADDARLVDEWLHTDCGLGDNARLENRIRSRGMVLARLFLEAIQKGPSAEKLVETERVAGARFEQRGAMMNREQRKITSNDEVATAARAETRDEYVAREKRNVSQRFRAQGVSGLALIGARTELQKIARDKTSPVRANAQIALKNLERKGPR